MGFRALGMRARPLLSDVDSYRGVHQIVHQLLSLRNVSLFAIRDRKAVEQVHKASLFQASPSMFLLYWFLTAKRLTRFRVTAHESAVYESRVPLDQYFRTMKCGTRGVQKAGTKAPKNERTKAL